MLSSNVRFASEASGNGFQNQPLRLSGLEKPSHPHKIGLTRRVTTNYQLSIRNQAKTKYFAFQAGPSYANAFGVKAFQAGPRLRQRRWILAQGFQALEQLFPKNI